MNYESTFIVSPELPADKVEELTAKAVKTIEAAKGTVKTVQQIGKKKLAYPINKFREGTYVYMEITGEGSMVASLESFFKFNDSVMRFMTVKVKKKKIAVKPVADNKQSAEKVSAEAKNDAAK
ncbi:MAG: 30S ribosomal protein S6 [Endomicrobium sp.]|jgi:small subunit ribosomal protein S6|nr:30S ribosomal protein S6 [Endomicrobium sp.]